jgi:hypothetical protein
VIRSFAVFLGFGLIFYLQSSLWESLFHEYVLDVRPWSRVGKHEASRWLRSWWFCAFEHGNVHHYLTYVHNYTQRFRSHQDEQKLATILSRRLSPKELRSMQACQYGASITWFGARYFMLPVYLNLMWIFAADGVANTLAVILADLIFGIPFVLFSKFVHPFLHLRYDDLRTPTSWLMRAFLCSSYGLAMRVLHFVHHRVPTRNYSLQIGADILRGRWLPPTEMDWENMLRIGLIAPEHRVILQRHPLLGHRF